MARRSLRIWLIGALREFRANWFSAVLTGVSLTIGALAVIATFAAGAIVNESLIAPAELLDGRAITVSGITNNTIVDSTDVVSLQAAQRELLTTGISTYVEWTTETRPEFVPVNAWGSTTPSFVQMKFGSGVRAGVFREPVVAEVDSRDAIAPSVLVNEQFVKRFGVEHSCLSVRLRTDSQPVTVCVRAIIADAQDIATVYVSAAQWLGVSSESLIGVTGTVYSHTTGSISRITAATQFVGARLGGIDPNHIGRSDTIAQLDGIRATVSAVFISIGAVALVLAMLGIVNISLAQSRESSREIAVRRAVGATRLHIIGELIGATVVVGCIAALTAGLAGYAIYVFVLPNQISTASGIELPSYPLAGVLAAVGINTAVSFAGALIPAIVASRRGFSTLLR
jgi:hypothetical protein